MSGFLLNGKPDSCTVCDPKITRSLSEHFLPTTVPSEFKRTEFTIRNAEHANENHATPGSVDQSETRSVTREPISGFVLISVKHTSRAPRKKIVKNSIISAPPERMDPSSLDSPIGNSSPNSSLSSTNGDHSRDDIYGSGSVEAEEFDDDDPDEEDSTAELHETLVGGLSSGHLAGGFNLNGLQLGQLTPCSPMFPKSKLPLHLVHPGSGNITPRVHNSAGLSSHAVPSSHRVLSANSYSQPLPLNGHAYLQHMPTPHGMFSPGPLLSPMVRSANGGLQVNNSHIGSQLLSQLAVDTAPASNHISPPQHNSHTPNPTNHMTEATAAVAESHLQNNAELVHAQGAPLDMVDPASLYSHFDHTQHPPYGRSHTPCRHYLRSTSESHPTHLMLGRTAVEESAVVACRLDSVEATLAAAASSLPPLQPASRFRKARIHETVEQWAHGRASIHDCRLRTVPDWVSELQKKTAALERDLHTALEQKFNCFSCLEMKALDSNPSNTQMLRIPTRAKSVALGQPLTAPQQQQQQQQQLKQQQQGESPNAPTRHSLFAFWDGGSRVHCSMSSVGRVVPIPECSAVLPNQASQDSDTCLLCVQSLVQQNGLLSSATVPDQPQLGQATDSNSNRPLEDHISASTATTTAATMDSVVSTTVLHNGVGTGTNTDPATAYLRRHYTGVTGHSPAQASSAPEHVARAGDSTLSAVDPGALRLHTDSFAQLSPEAVNYLARLQSPFPPGMEATPHLALTQIHPLAQAKIPVQDSIGELAKPRVSGLVPPTSPTFTDGLDPPPPTDVPVQLNTRVDLPTELYRTSLPGNITISAVRFPAVSGSYQNVTQLSGAPGYPLANGALCNGPTAPASVFASAQTAAESRQLSTTSCPSHLSMPPQSGSETLLVDVHGDAQPKLISTFDLETRITRSMDTIRSAMEQAFQRELAVVHSENVRLASEVERLSREVSQLRGYQAAFYALRPFVNQEAWDHLHQQQQSHHRLSHPDGTPPQTSQPPPASIQRQS